MKLTIPHYEGRGGGGGGGGIVSLAPVLTLLKYKISILGLGINTELLVGRHQALLK